MNPQDLASMSSTERASALSDLERKMTAMGLELRAKILSQPPLDLLSWISLRPILAVSPRQDEPSAVAAATMVHDQNQFVLEYVHASLASASPQDNNELDMSVCESIVAMADELRSLANLYAIIQTSEVYDGVFGEKTSEIEFLCLGSWINLRGNRYHLVEREFYEFVLTPHNEQIREAFGVDASAIAVGIQQHVDSRRSGLVTSLKTSMDALSAIPRPDTESGGWSEEAVQSWRKSYGSGAAKSFGYLYSAGSFKFADDSPIPKALLDELSFEVGEDDSFFSEGPFCASPFGTLPARRKPLIKMQGSYFSIDMCSFRDYTYRAILHLLEEHHRAPDQIIRETREAMCEGAFQEIFGAYLRDSEVFDSFYYKDPVSGQWVENDTLILCEDVMIILEAKSGSSITIEPPLPDSQRHTRAVHDLVEKAYKQCARFLSYLESAVEVPIYSRGGRAHGDPVRVIRGEEYRIKIPIGITVETFAPISSMCNLLPKVRPVAGVHSFLSLSIDEMLVFRRFLPNLGSLVHFFSIWQSASLNEVLRFQDSIDRLGAYIKMNRFDSAYFEDQEARRANLILVEGADGPIDEYFRVLEEPESAPMGQEMPSAVAGLLDALDSARPKNWLRVDAFVRESNSESRGDLGKSIQDAVGMLHGERPVPSPEQYWRGRLLILSSEDTVFFWIQRVDFQDDPRRVRHRFAGAAFATGKRGALACVVNVDSEGTVCSVSTVSISIPNVESVEWPFVRSFVRRFRSGSEAFGRGEGALEVKKSIGRNEPCPCGGGKKFKRCHGR